MGWVVIEQELMMRRNEWCWIRTKEEQATGKTRNCNWILNVRTAERQSANAKGAREFIERINQGSLFR